jgi:hypothetical protein
MAPRHPCGIETDGAKLLGALIGKEPFRTDFVARRVSKATASVAAIECLPLDGASLLYQRVRELARSNY